MRRWRSCVVPGREAPDDRGGDWEGRYTVDIRETRVENGAGVFWMMCEIQKGQAA